MEREQQGAIDLSKFEFRNQIETVDQFYDIPGDWQNAGRNAQVQRDKIEYKHCRISLLAVMRILEATSINVKLNGKNVGLQEIAGELIGRVSGDTFYVVDAYAIPTVNADTQMNAVNNRKEGYNDTEKYRSSNVRAYTQESAYQYNAHVGFVRVGWFQSHLGQGHWLKDAEIEKQRVFQGSDEIYPKIALIIDPVRTLASGVIELGAFRVGDNSNIIVENQLIARSDAQQYKDNQAKTRRLKVSYFKSKQDEALVEFLWKKHVWRHTLAKSPIFANRVTLIDAADELAQRADKISSEKIKVRVTADEIIGNKTRGNHDVFARQALQRTMGLVNETIKTQLFGKKL